jgi:hypothetical protein
VLSASLSQPRAEDRYEPAETARPLPQVGGVHLMVRTVGASHRDAFDSIVNLFENERRNGLV